MGRTYGRFLHKDEDVASFVDCVLGIEDLGQKRQAINSITAVERTYRGCDQASTWRDHQYRDFEYVDDKKRNALRQQIVSELIDLERPDDDEKICLGRGGAKPLTRIKNDKMVFYIIGLPASGKSGIAGKVADFYGAYLVDSDFAKRKLPEYYNQKCGASMVHEESDNLVFTYPSGNLFKYCIDHGNNMVVPKIGSDYNDICTFSEKLHKLGYRTFLISIDLDRIKATRRAYNRFVETQRYVPLSLIFDDYANDPILNYYKLLHRNKKCYNGYAQISTDVEKGNPPLLLEYSNIPQFEELFGGDRCGRKKVSTRTVTTGETDPNLRSAPLTASLSAPG